MYEKLLPNPNSKHQLTEFISHRGESKLESFHDRFTHFANGGMRDSLADNLNLSGTARYNIAIRHKKKLAQRTRQENPSQSYLLQRKTIPAAWERQVPYFNHSELWFVNGMAGRLGMALPFPDAERLQADNGERFFSEYITIFRPAQQKYSASGFCLCPSCHGDKERQSETSSAATTNATTISTVAPPPQSTGPAISQVSQPHSIIPNNSFAFNSAPFQPLAPAPFNSIPLPFFPMQQQPHLAAMVPYVVPPMACCAKYMHWLLRRVGRPPHDTHCGFRRQQLLRQQQGTSAPGPGRAGMGPGRAGMGEGNDLNFGIL